MKYTHLGIISLASALSFSAYSGSANLDYAGRTSLPEVVNYTIGTNPDVLATVKSKLAADQSIRQAQGEYLPVVDLQLGIGPETSRNATTRAIPGEEDQTLTRREVRLTIVENLFNGLATTHEVHRRRAISNSSAHLIDNEAEAAAIRVAELYLNVLKRREIVVLGRANVNAHVRTNDMIGKRTKSGISKKADKRQAEGRLALARANLNAEVGNLRETEALYLRTVGLMPARTMEKPSVNPEYMPATLDAAIEQGLESQPRLKSANEDIVSAQEQHKAAKAPNYPQFNVELGATKDNDIDGVNGTNHDYSAMLRMYYNLYNGGIDLARQRETALFAEEAMHVRDDTYRQVEENIRLAWAALKTNERLHDYYGKHMRAAKDTVKAYRKQFELGQRTLLDLLDAENEYFIAGISFTSAKYDKMLSKYRVINGTGTLVRSLGLTPPAESYSVAHADD